MGRLPIYCNRERIKYNKSGASYYAFLNYSFFKSIFNENKFIDFEKSSSNLKQNFID